MSDLDARTREWYLEAEITMLNMRVSELEAALKPFADEAQFFISKALDNHLAAPDRLYLTIGQFRAAHKVLERK